MNQHSIKKAIKHLEGEVGVYNGRSCAVSEAKQNERVVIQITPLALLNALRETDPYIATIYTEGSCYRLHLMLKRLWPEAIPVTNATGDHVGSMIDGEVYDINGIVDWSYRAMDDDDIEMAERWSFAKKSMLEVGECPACGEPIVA